MSMHQTTFVKVESVKRSWYSASAKGKVLGPLAVKVATALMGRHKPDYSPGVDSGDFVIVTDVESLVFTGKKAERKTYRFHSGFMGGLSEISLGELHADKPEFVFQLAVKRMLPKTVQGRHQLKRLKIFKSGAHTHVGQRPQPLP
jgi:large subunit ribosomal protein L13